MALAPCVQRLRLMKIIVAIFLTLTAVSPALSQTPRIVTASQANGTYRDRQNEIKILALGHNQLRIQMDLTYEFKSAAGPTANTGEASGEATIENDTAVFYPSDNHSCKVTITFLAGNKIKVSEEHSIECGFGMNVSSAGTYHERSKPASRSSTRVNSIHSRIRRHVLLIGRRPLHGIDHQNTDRSSSRLKFESEVFRERGEDGQER